MEWLTSDTIIILVSAMAAAISFAAFALPYLQRSEKKDRVRAVVEKKRRVLMQRTREELNHREAKTTSARESVASFFKVQQMAGEYGERMRVLLLQAGIRDPMAPIMYIAAQFILPVVFLGFSMIFVFAAEEELSQIIKLSIFGGAVLTGFFLPRLLVKNTAIKRQEEINLAFPDSLDMMLVCVQGGIGLEQTVDRVADEMAEHAPVLAEELGILSAEMAMLNDRRAALNDFGRRIGGHAKSFATALIQAEQYGTSVSQALRVMSAELREIRMAKAEEKAASLPPKLTVPMILFFLPALFIVILAPAFLKATAAGVGG